MENLVIQIHYLSVAMAPAFKITVMLLLVAFAASMLIVYTERSNVK